MSCFRLIHGEKATNDVRTMCRVVGVSRSTAPASKWDRRCPGSWQRSVDVALLSEVPTGVLPEAGGALYEAWGTRSRDRKRRDWCTAIVSPHGGTEIRDARAVSYRGRRPNVRFESSRPGSWTAGSISVPGVGAVTCVSLYGLLDELSEALVHRSLSEISPLFRRYDVREPALFR